MIRAKVRVAGLASAPSPIVLVLPPDATVQRMLDMLVARYPRLAGFWRGQEMVRQIAVDNELIRDLNKPLVDQDGDTAEVSVLMIPPMQGACCRALRAKHS